MKQQWIELKFKEMEERINRLEKGSKDLQTELRRARDKPSLEE